MNELALVRIDDRLIHGQVVIKWLRYLGCNEVTIVDEELSEDVDLQTVLRLAAPRGVKLRVASIDQVGELVEDWQPCGSCAAGSSSAVSVEDSLPFASKSQNCRRRVLILVKTPSTALALIERGLSIGELNVGGLAGVEGARRVYRSISVTPDQMEILREISSRGIRVYFQTVPEERALELAEVVPIPEAVQ